MVKIGNYPLKALKISLYFLGFTFVIICLANLLLVNFFEKFSYNPIYHFIELIVFAVLVSATLFLLLSRDYFVKKQMADLFLEEEKKFQLFFENANDAILLLKEQYVIDCNLKACEIFGCNKYELLGKSFISLSRESENIENILGLIKNSSSKPQQFEWKYLMKNKTPFYAEVSLNQISIAGVHFIQVIIRDISELKLSQLAFSNSEEKFKMIFNSISDGMIIFTEDDEILEVNDTILSRYGLTREQFNELPAEAKFPPAIVKAVNSHIPELQSQESISFEVENVITREKVMHLEMRVKKIDYDGRKAFVAVARDISQRKVHQMEIYNAVIQAEEIERSRIAKELHDGVSPILSTAKLYAQSLHDCSNEELKTNILSKIELTINESIQSISEISNKLSPHILQNFGVTAAVGSFVDKINDLRKVKINLVTDWNGRLEENIEVTLYRVIIELINNSLKHSEADDIQILIRKDRAIRLIFSDNGKGCNIKEAMGRKKGMGLFNMINRVKSLNGTIDYFSEPGKGFKAIVNFNENI